MPAKAQGVQFGHGHAGGGAASQCFFLRVSSQGLQRRGARNLAAGMPAAGLRARGASSERWLGTLGESLARPCLCDWRRRYLAPLPPSRRQCIGPRSMAAIYPSPPSENLALVIWSRWWWRFRRHVLLGGTTEEELAQTYLSLACFLLLSWVRLGLAASCCCCFDECPPLASLFRRRSP
jgi:hypothetical protein